MRAKDRGAARRQLDKRLTLFRKSSFARPSRGWVKAIREALGLTTRQLGMHMGLSQPRAVEIEKAEVAGSITLESLRRVARAMDCELVYALVPRQSLETMVEQRAMALANRRVKSAHHTMVLEDQALDPSDEQEQIKRLARQLAEQSGSKLWEGE